MMPKKQDVLAKLGDWAVTDPPFGTWADSCLWKMLLYELSAGNLHEIPCWRIGPEPPHAENILPGTLVPQRFSDYPTHCLFQLLSPICLFFPYVSYW